MSILFVEDVDAFRFGACVDDVECVWFIYCVCKKKILYEMFDYFKIV